MGFGPQQAAIFPTFDLCQPNKPVKLDGDIIGMMYCTVFWAIKYSLQ